MRSGGSVRADNRTTNGVPPVTEAQKSEVLEVTPQATYKSYTMYRYGTTSGILYDEVNSIEEMNAALDKYSSRVVGSLSTYYVDEMECAPLLHLRDLL